MAIQQRALELLVEEGLPGSCCAASDLTGTEDHWNLRVEWAGFAGRGLLEQHRAVMEVLRPSMEQGGSGAIHAVQIKTVVPAAGGDA